MPPSTLDKLSRHKTKDITLSKPVNQTINTDRLKMAKEEAERAIKVNLKIFKEKSLSFMIYFVYFV
jgi:hypothetical protein